MGVVNIKRIYDARSRSDGQRVLVDRLWPRGVSKAKAALDEWFKDIAPSPRLRLWFGHRADRWSEFKVRYRRELDANPAAVAHLCELLGKGDLTLLYGARDPAINQALVLAEYLRSHCPARRGKDRSGA